jgi:peptide/nickel transport system permease protein
MSYIIKLAGKRLALGLLTIIVISMLVFMGVEALPGDTAEAILGQSATPETVEAFRKEPSAAYSVCYLVEGLF